MSRTSESASAASTRISASFMTVRRGALDDGVDREALAERADLPVARLQLGNLAAAGPTTS